MRKHASPAIFHEINYVGKFAILYSNIDAFLALTLWILWLVFKMVGATVTPF